MPEVTDTAGATLTSVSLALAENAQLLALVALVPCVAGMWLTADASAKAQVLARRQGSVSPFVDIAAAPIDLADYAGQTIPFEFKIAAGEVSSPVERVVLPVRVTFNP